MKRSTRIAVTLVCFLVVNTMFTTFFVQIDSFSHTIWEYETDVGPATFVLRSTQFIPEKDDVDQIEGVEKSEDFVKGWASVIALPVEQVNDTQSIRNDESAILSSINMLGPSGGPIINTSVDAVINDPDFFETFPSMFNLTDGHWPEAEDEIAFSEWVAIRFDVGVGDIVTYESGFDQVYHTLIISGVYSHPEIHNRNRWYYEVGDVVVQPEYIGDREIEYYMYINAERTGFSPLFASESINVLSNIAEEIRGLDPTYSMHFHTRFLLDDLLSKGIQRYLDWSFETKWTQLVRTQTAFFLVLILSAIVIHFNLTHHNKELELLSARGATDRQITVIVLKELVKMALLSFSLSLILGTVLSRVGLSSTSYLRPDFSVLLSLPFLITFETLLITGILAIAVPLLLTGILLTLPKVKSMRSVEQGRLARLVRGFNLIRWDFVIVGLSLVLLLVLWEASVIISQVPVFSAIAVVIPVVFMAGLANLFGKGIRYATRRSSNGLHSIYKLTLGLRNLGTNAKHIGQTVLVIALGISIIWNTVLVIETQPNTSLGHVRFAISGDLTFKVSTDSIDSLEEFRSNLSSLDGVLDHALLEVYSMSMSSSLSDSVSFVSIVPDEFAKVGYDSGGIPLSESSLMDTLETLKVQPSGAIITSDIARTFAIEPGDTMRTFRENGSEIETKSFTVTDVVNALPDTYVSGTGFPPPQSDSSRVGSKRVWINRQYAEDVLGSETVSSLFLCVRLDSSTDGRDILEQVFLSSDPELINGYSIASDYLFDSTNNRMNTLSQSIDTSISVLVFAVITCVLALYILNTKSERDNNYTLLNVLGIEKSSSNWIQVIEVLALNIFAILLLLLSSPIIIQNTFYLIIMTSNEALIVYPQPIIPVIPFLPLVLLLGITLSISLLMIVFDRRLHDKQKLAKKRHYAWKIIPSFSQTD